MTNKTKMLFLVITGAALSASSYNAAAQPTEGYWSAPAGVVWKDPSGLCWRTGAWTPAMATEECDPDLVKKPEPKPMPAPPPAPAPMPKPAPAPAAAPVPAPMPAPAPAPIPQKVTLKADVLFNFNRSSLTPADRAKLDDLAGRMSALNVEVVIATGHTDPLGSSEYNQKLSVRRADSVKAFLMSKGVDADRIYAEGKGETQQVKACPKSMSRPARIKCLAPNRRVEIQVVGTQSN